MMESCHSNELLTVVMTLILNLMSFIQVEELLLL
jgi:hypothetical protein